MTRNQTPSYVDADVWPRIAEECKVKGPIRAAIAYVGVDAPSLLPLRRGDVLIVNASDATLATGGTHPDALQAFVDRGVQVFSHPNLHAKVVVTSAAVIVGSANASKHSCSLFEAVSVNSDPTMIKEARTSLDALKGLDAVDDAFISRARTIWRPTAWSGRGSAAAKTSTPLSGAAGFLPAEPFRLFLIRTSTHYPTDAAAAMLKREKAAVRRTIGPSATYGIDWFCYSPGFREYDVIVRVETRGKGHFLATPAVVVSAPFGIPGEIERYNFIRYRRSDPQLRWREVAGRLSAVGITISADIIPVRAKAKRDALLGLWSTLDAPALPTT